MMDMVKYAVKFTSDNAANDHFLWPRACSLVFALFEVVDAISGCRRYEKVDGRKLTTTIVSPELPVMSVSN